MSDIKKPQGLAMEELKQTIVNVVNSFQKEYELKFYTLEPFFTALANSIRDEAAKEIEKEAKEYEELKKSNDKEDSKKSDE